MNTEKFLPVISALFICVILSSCIGKPNPDQDSALLIDPEELDVDVLGVNEAATEQASKLTKAPGNDLTPIVEGSVSTFREVLFQDDFSDTGSGWDRHTDADGSSDYENGQYLIQVVEVRADFFANPGNEYPGDISIEVTATKIGGVDDNSFGIICRYQDPSNYYEFVISSDGYYTAFKTVDNSTTFMDANGWEESSAINIGDATNTIRVECVGNTFRLFANGTLLLEVQANALSGGDVGLIAGTLDVPGTIIAFDDFVVHGAE